MVFILIFMLSAYASQESQSLEDIIAQNEIDNSELKVESQNQKDKNQSFIEGLNEASDLAVADIQGAEKVTEQIRIIAAWIVQVVTYGTIAFLAVRVVLDLVYIALPFTRGFLNKGSGAGQDNIGTSFGNMGAASRIGSIKAMGGMRSAGQMGSINDYSNQAPGQSTRQYQIISNAAINAVENSNGQSIIKIYAKDTIVTLITIPVLITLTATGALTSIGFAIGEALVDLLETAIKMISV